MVPQQTLGFLITPSSQSPRPSESPSDLVFGWPRKKDVYTHTLKSNIDTQNDAIFGKIKYVFQPTILFHRCMAWCIFPKSQSS